MTNSQYFQDLLDLIEFIIAFGSVLGLLLVIVGALWLIVGGRYERKSAIKLIISGGILLFFIGFHIGIQYFGLFR